LVLDISEPIKPADHKSLLLHVAQNLGITDFIDTACTDLSRYFYLPRCPIERIEDYVFLSVDGDAVNIEACLDRIKFDQKSLGPEPSVALDSSVNTRDETEFNIAEIKEFLGYCSADCEYGKWRNIIWSVSSLGWDIAPSLLLDWSKTSLRHWAKETAQQAEAALTNLMNEFDPERGITIGTLIAEAKNNGWASASPFENLAFEMTAANYQPPDSLIILSENPHSEESSQSILDHVRAFSITGQSTELKRKMLSDVFIMDRIAILGQWTSIYAAPGTGKTLLTLWMLRDQISKGLIDGDQVFYVNADDNYKGMTEKLEIAEKFGLQVLVPNFNGFSVDQMVPLMISLAKSGQAHGVIFVLDTLKKFTNLMDKRTSSEFGNTARQFVTAGGSLIVLAHTNKHKDVEGKGIYSGTSDIVDDSDCGFIIDKLDESDEFGGKKTTVEFSNIKSRGDVASMLGFTYSTGGQSYSDLLDSVIRIDEKSLEGSKREIVIEKLLARDVDFITAVCLAISEGVRSKDMLVKEVKKRTAETTARVKSVIENRTGRDYALGQRWSVTQGENNAQIFSALPTPYILNN